MRENLQTNNYEHKLKNEKKKGYVYDGVIVGPGAVPKESKKLIMPRGKTTITMAFLCVF